MNTKLLFSAIVASFISSAVVQAQSQLYWYPGGSGSATWDTTSVNWYNYSLGASTAFTSGDKANFDWYPGATITIAGSVAASSVEFYANTTITGGTLSLVGTGGDTNFNINAGVTGVVSSYVLNNSGIQTTQYSEGYSGPGTGGTLELTGGGNFGSGGYEQQKANTLWLAAGTYTTSGGFNANNWAGIPDPTIKFTIGSGVANGGARLNIGGQLGGTAYGGSGINSMNLDLVSLGSLTGDVVLMNYGSMVGTAFHSVTLNGADLPADYTVNYNYNNAKQIALVAIPEPSTWVTLLGGLGMLATFRRRRA
jgi:hypothetical protein